MTKDDILTKIEYVAEHESDLVRFIITINDLNFAYNRLAMIEGAYTQKKEINICE